MTLTQTIIALWLAADFGFVVGTLRASRGREIER